MYTHEYENIPITKDSISLEDSLRLDGDDN